jgi:hypothetical protein
MSSWTRLALRDGIKGKLLDAGSGWSINLSSASFRVNVSRNTVSILNYGGPNSLVIEMEAGRSPTKLSDELSVPASTLQALRKHTHKGVRDTIHVYPSQSSRHGERPIAIGFRGSE